MKQAMTRAMESVLAWSWGASPSLQVQAGGLINQTFWVCVDGVKVAVLQRLNTDIFVPEVHEDIEAVTRHLLDRGLTSPTLIRTTAGMLWHTDRDGAVWRCLTLVGNRTLHAIDQPVVAEKAARLVGRFHGAVADLQWDFRSVRSGAHDTAGHMARLIRALANHSDHRLYSQLSPVADAILDGWDRLGSLPELPERVIHGDLKISNIRFADGEAVALIDLDTFAMSSLDIELGDAMRSWCNRAGEDDPTAASFDLAIFGAAMRGYASSASGVTEMEWNSIVVGIRRICWELAARFAWDTLEETYFGFDASFGGRGEHNLHRAKGQVALALSVEAQEQQANRLVAEARGL